MGDSEVLVKGVWCDRRSEEVAEVAVSSILPSEEDRRGFCPDCRAPLLSLFTYEKGRGYILRWCCANHDCEYERVL